MATEQLLEAEAGLVTPASTPGEERCLAAAGGKTKAPSSSSQQDKASRRWALVWSLTPCCMLVISLAQLAVFLVADAELQRLLRWDPALALRRRQPHRLVTYALLHRGATHLVLNLLLQLLLAAPLAREQGGARSAVVYVAGAVAGALGAALLQPRPLVGASAAVYALILSHLSHLYLNLPRLQYRWYRVFCVLVLLASDGVLCAVHARTAGISVGAHGAGGVAGALVALAGFQGEPRRLARAAAAVAVLALYAGGAAALLLLPQRYFNS